VSPRVRFAALSVLYSAVIYAGVRLLAPDSAALWAMGAATPVIAVMLASQGHPWRRKLLFSGGTAALSILLFAVVGNSFLGAAADAATSSGAFAPTDWQLAAFVAVQVLFLGVPLAALALFVGRRPSLLWSKDQPART
jgi:hypothetical protein